MYMKKLIKRLAAFVMLFLMVFSVLSMLSRQVSAAAFGGIMNQMEEQWSYYKFDGYTLRGTGCGLFSLANAVGYMNNVQMDVPEMAYWAYDKGYYNGLVGTYGSTFYQNAGREYGPVFGFTIDANTNGRGYWGTINDARIKNHLMNGGTVVIHVENHYMALVGYNSGNGMYHVYNSTPGTIDGTSMLNGDVWVTGEQLNTGDSKVDWYVLVCPGPVDSQKPVISDIRVTDVSYSGYTVKCTVTDDHKVEKVAFPTWTHQNGQDDLAADFMSTQLGTREGNTFTFRVNSSAHSYETGFYVTHIYAVDKKGNTAAASTGDIQLPADSQKPVISHVEYSEVSASGYTLSCTVTDNWGIQSVSFPTWTVENGQDDLQWYTQPGSGGSRYTLRVNASEHNNETGYYVTHIYARDLAGNETVLNPDPIRVMDDNEKPVISDARITNVTAAGYTVTCKVTDNWGIQSVSFPTWTVAGGQDDLQWYTNQGTKDGDTYTFKIKTANHNGETGCYATHIYASDCAGNTTSVHLDAVDVKDPLLKVTLVPSSGYNIKDGMLTKVKADTKVSDLLGRFKNDELEVLDKNGKKLTAEAVVTTGSTVNLYLGGQRIHTVTVVVSGDVDGDGTVDTTDYMRVKAAILGSLALSKGERLAADVDRSESIDATDYLRIKAHILGTYDLYG